MSKKKKKTVQNYDSSHHHNGIYSYGANANNILTATKHSRNVPSADRRGGS